MSDLLTVESLIAFLTLGLLEIVLGIDNIIFITVLSGKLPPEERKKAVRMGLGLAMISRILLLLGITWVMKLTTPLFTLFHHEVTGKDLILLGGGLFLIAKATYEIHDKLEAPETEARSMGFKHSLMMILIQIMILDIIFSLDSVITAVGMADHVEIMIAAVIVAVLVMMVYAGAVGRFVEKHPTLKILALSFLLLIGMMLMIEGVGKEISKGYIYFALGFSLLVEMINIRIRKARPVKLNQTYVMKDEWNVDAGRVRGGG